MHGLAPQSRTFLLLQGPPGPFFYQLGQAIAASGHRVLRVNLNGGDDHDWPDAPGTATRPIRFRGRSREWPRFIDHLLHSDAVTDLVLFGDCRPMHLTAHRLARLAGIRVHVFEEGYIRPDWLTLERNGVNGHSSLPRTPEEILHAARGLPAPPQLPRIGAVLGQRVRDTWDYFRHMVWGTARYPFHRSHRTGSIIIEGFGWVWHQLVKPTRARQTEAALARISRERYFLLPLQLSSDYQIRVHSPFPDMVRAADYIIESFAHHAPPDTVLLIKDHPLDYHFFSWRRYIARAAKRFGIAGRLVHIPGGDLKTLADHSLGLVTVNSTSATFALASGIPVMALGTAVYAIKGLVHSGPPETFWTAPSPPDPQLWDAFCRVLHDRCLVRGGLASPEAIEILVENALERLLAA